MGFLDTARSMQKKADDKKRFVEDMTVRDEQTLFTDEMIESYAKIIADSMKDVLLQKIAARQFKFVYGMFNRKKHCHYEEEYQAKIECHPRGMFLQNTMPSEKWYCQYADARPSFPNEGFISIYNASDGEMVHTDTINCWSLDHVIKPYRRAVEMLKHDGINAKLDINDFGISNWRMLTFHSEVPCDADGNV